MRETGSAFHNSYTSFLNRDKGRKLPPALIGSESRQSRFENRTHSDQNIYSTPGAIANQSELRSNTGHRKTRRRLIPSEILGSHQTAKPKDTFDKITFIFEKSIHNNGGITIDA